MLEKLDDAVGKLIENLGNWEENHYIIWITGDHTTPWSE